MKWSICQPSGVRGVQQGTNYNQGQDHQTADFCERTQKFDIRHHPDLKQRAALLHTLFKCHRKLFMPGRKRCSLLKSVLRKGCPHRVSSRQIDWTSVNIAEFG
jgi:hypothetical protein